MVMEDLEGCMQLGVATSPYTHRVVTRILVMHSFPWALGYDFLVNSKGQKSKAKTSIKVHCLEMKDWPLTPKIP
jgi:hypothetical protein